MRCSDRKYINIYTRLLDRYLWVQWGIRTPPRKYTTGGTRCGLCVQCVMIYIKRRMYHLYHLYFNGDYSSFNGIKSTRNLLMLRTINFRNNYGAKVYFNNIRILHALKCLTAICDIIYVIS